MNNHPPTAWLMLNGYGVLVAVLEIVVGASNLLTPERLITQYGHIPALSYLWLAGYLAGGILLLAALWTRRVEVEVYAALALVAANLTQLATALTTLGPDGIARDAIISLFLIVALGMRIRALLHGGTFVVPRWHRKRR